jgi:hypothetical protein
MREANRTAASLTGMRAWDVPCIAAALVAAAPQQPAQQAVRVPLTDEQIADLYFDGFSISKLLEFARAIEAAHGISAGGDQTERIVDAA